MPYADWAGVTRDLTTALERLADGEFLILGEPSPSPDPRRRLFARPAKPPTARYVQALRVDEVFSAECVGATSLGGTCEMDDAAIEQLRSMGWLTPEESKAEFGDITPNFDTYVELDYAPGLADLMVASLAVIGAHPQTLVLEFSEGTLSAVTG